MVAVDENRSAETSVELLREFERTGQSEPFEAFMRRHAAMVYATCLKVTRDPHDAEDATQATFLTLASKSRLNGEIRQPEAWLRKVAHRLSLDLIRSKKRRINRENLRSEMTSEEAPLDSSDHAGNGELKGILNEELAKLPASYRMPLILHYFGGLSREEMADQLKLKPSTLGVRLHRAREQLRKRLSNRGIALPAVALTALLTEVVRESVCSHLTASTAQQAVAIAAGHASAPIFTAGPSVATFRLLTDLLGGSKLKFLASLLVLGSAISMTSGQVQQLIPKLIREWMPSLKSPTIPKLQFQIPVPRFSADVAPRPTESLPETEFAARFDLPAPRVSPQFVPAQSPDFFGATFATAITPPPQAPMIEAPIGVSQIESPIRVGTTIEAPAKSVSKSTRTAVATGSYRPSIAASADRETNKDGLDSSPVITAPAAKQDAWNSVIASTDPTSSTSPNVPIVPESVREAAPVELTAAVIGSVPSVGGAGAGGGSDLSAPLTNPNANAVTPAKSVIASRVATFQGTSANYGGYSDAAWASAQLIDLSNSLEASSSDAYSFAPPTVPTDAETLSVNGARVTLKNATTDDVVNISFVDTSATQIPTLPRKHQFIGVWELDTLTEFEAVDLLVRYDDLRAARMGLSENILKLWVSDGETWTLMWNDRSFGRDIYDNFLWVSAGSDVKFFAVSAPEPTTLAALVAAGTVLARRRRV